MTAGPFKVGDVVTLGGDYLTLNDSSWPQKDDVGIVTFVSAVQGDHVVRVQFARTGHIWWCAPSWFDAPAPTLT